MEERWIAEAGTLWEVCLDRVQGATEMREEGAEAVADEVAKIGEESASGRGFLLVKYEEGAVFGADAGRWCVIVVRTAERSRCEGDWCAGRRGVYTAVGG